MKKQKTFIGMVCLVLTVLAVVVNLPRRPAQAASTTYYLVSYRIGNPAITTENVEKGSLHACRKVLWQCYKLLDEGANDLKLYKGSADSFVAIDDNRWGIVAVYQIQKEPYPLPPEPITKASSTSAVYDAAKDK